MSILKKHTEFMDEYIDNNGDFIKKIIEHLDYIVRNIEDINYRLKNLEIILIE